MLKWLEKYFTFTRGERNAIVVLLVLSFLVLIAPKVYFLFRPVQHADNSKYEKEIEAFSRRNATDNRVEGERSGDSLNVAGATVEANNISRKKPEDEQYFEFDPNKIGVPEWQHLGFSEKDAQSIEKYKAGGGKFYRAQDLLRLYCMTEKHYFKLKPYVKIDVDALPKRNYGKY